MGLFSRLRRRRSGGDGERAPLLPEQSGAQPQPQPQPQPRKTPLPRMQLAVLCLMRLSEPIAFTCIFPFVPQMLHDNLPGVPSKQIGYYAGLVESLFALVQFLTGLLWGSLSDRIGRKPVLLIGLLGTFASVNAFGLSRSFAQMIAARALNGLMNGNVAVIRSVLGELTDETNQARAFSFLPLMYAIGSIIGPTLGGTLSDPVHSFPSLFGHSAFLAKYPYWLPCGVAGALNIVGFGIGFFYLEETLPSKVAPPLSPAAEPAGTPEGSATPTLAHRLSEPDLHRATLARAASRLVAQRAGEAAAAAEREAERERQAAHEEQPAPFRAILTGNVVKVLTNQALINLINISYMAALPLFCYTDVKEGGLSFSKADIGNLLAANGVCAIFVQLFLFPYLEARIGGPQPLLKRVLPFFASAFLLFPLAHAAALLGRAEVWGVLSVILVVRSIGGMSIVTGTLCINNIAPNRASLGRVNGLAQSLGSLARAIGPLGSSSLFAFSIEHPNILGGQLIWYTLFAIAGTTWLLSLRIRDANKARWRKEKRGTPAATAAEDDAAPEEVFTTMFLCATTAPTATLETLLPPQLCAELNAEAPRTSDAVSAHALARRIPLLREHLRRLSSAVAALHAAAPSAWQTPSSYAALADERLLAALSSALAGVSEARRVRLALSRAGDVAVQHFALSAAPRTPLAVRLDVQPTQPHAGTLADVVLRHKTSARAVYDDARARVGATLGAPAGKDATRETCFDVLLWTEEAGEQLLTESSIASVLLQLPPSISGPDSQRFITPPRRLPLLPGVLRSELLRRGAVREEEIGVARLRKELERGATLWLVNALRGAFEVRLIP